MKFYKVNPAADQIRFNNPVTGWHLIANELHTVKEVNKMTFTPKQIKQYFTPVEHSKFKTYWFFGARFQNKLN